MPIPGPFVAICLLVAAGSALAHSPGELATEALLDLSVEQLMHIPVTTATRTVNALADTPAAVFVITAEDLRRTAVQSLPEALRLAPGLQVARVESDKWAVSSRGLDGRFARQMQVLIDGRSVYSTFFSGTEWELLNIPIAEVERIEVIRGPGGAAWGSNAVSGVINIITKPVPSATYTRLTLGTGTEERAYGLLQQAGRLNETVGYRAYVQGFDRDGGEGRFGIDAADDWREQRAGLRLEWDATPEDRVTVQGDYYRGRLGQTLLVTDPAAPVQWPGSIALPEDMRAHGGYFMADWRHSLGGPAYWAIRAYGQYDDRNELSLRDRRASYAIEFEHRLPTWQERHTILWGASYRLVRDHIGSSPYIQFDDEQESIQTLSSFVQDEITLVPERLSLTLGSRFELTDRNGWEPQPTARLAFTPTARQTWWAAVSRAVRVPSRMEFTAQRWLLQGMMGPWPYTAAFLGSPNLRPEELIAYEVGGRFLLTDRLSLDVALYYHDFSDLITLEYAEGTAGTLAEELVAVNGFDASIYGGEAALRYQPTDWWRLDLAYTFMRVHEHPRSGIDYYDDAWDERDAPRHQASLLSSFRLTRDLDLNLWARYVDTINDVASYTVSSYVTLDASLRWHLSPRYELMLAGQNLLDNSHPEYYPSSLIPTASTSVERSFSIQLVVQL